MDYMKASLEKKKNRRGREKEKNVSSVFMPHSAKTAGEWDSRGKKTATVFKSTISFHNSLTTLFFVFIKRRLRLALKNSKNRKRV